MRYVFANCEVDNQLRTVRRGATQRTLRPKPLQLLCYLLDHSDRVVSHQELAEQLWPNQSVRDALIRDNVQTVRRAVGDTSRAQRIIQTLPGQGYRVVVPVTLIVEEIPVFKGSFGLSHGHMSVKIKDKIMLNNI